MKKRLLALAVAFTLIMTEAAAFPAMTSAAEDKTADTITFDEAIEEDADGTSDTEDEYVSEKDSLTDDNDFSDETAECSDEDAALDSYAEQEKSEEEEEAEAVFSDYSDEEEYEEDVPELSEEECQTGYIPAPNYRAPTVVESDSDSFQDIEKKYVPEDFLNSWNLRDQNPYGVCWAFSSIGLAEFSLAKQNINKDLSELHLVYFTANSQTDPLGGTKGDESYPLENDYMKNGGNYVMSGNTLASWQGAADEAKADFKKEAARINRGGSLDPSIAYADEAHLENIYRLNLSENRNEVKKLIKQYGAAGVNYFSANGLYGMTMAKCYNSKNNCYYCPEAIEANHAVMIVGWDDDFQASNFNQNPGSNGAWLIRNSWTNGGDYAHHKNYSGYFWMSYNDKSLTNPFWPGANEATFFDFGKADNYDHNYQYDGSVLSNFTELSKAANIFTVNNEYGFPETLEAISFSIQDGDVDYSVDIYKNPYDMSNPASGDKVCSIQNWHADYSGMHTVKLPSPVSLKDGDVFSVVISFSDSVMFDTDYETDFAGCHLGASAEAGQSFTHDYGDNWFDYGAWYDANLRIKAYTKDVKENIIPLEKITFTSGVYEDGMTLNKEEGRQVGYLLSPFEATSRKLVWTSSDEGVATVDESGFVTAIAPGTAEITATAKVGGASSSFTVNVTKELTDIRIVPSQTGYLTVGKSYPFRIASVPSGFSLSGNVSWSSDNENVARITDGELSVVGAGYATITAELDDMSDQYTVYCVPDEPAVTATKNGNTVNISFKPAAGAQKYLIYREPHDTGANVSGRTPIKEIVHKDGAPSYSIIDDISGFTGSVSYIYTYINYYVKAVPAAGSQYSSEGSACVYDLSDDYKSFKITYILGKCQNHLSNPSALVYAEPISLKDAIPPEGYNFVGWKESTRGVFTDALPLEDWNWNYDQYMEYTVTAVIAPNKYQVRYFANGGTGTMQNTAAEYDKAVNLR
ncbi:MAG: Ig-like domain-containing protein, partial [Lachnospiraceae bacterium]|nr:Ig-like domain-containing protein [Lachnospiraceae bacterium]